MGQRVIPVAVTAEYIGGDGVTLGAAGSHNSVLIEYDFRSAGPQWDDISGRYVLWTNPQGNSTNRINLGVSEKVAGYEGVYQAAPPADAMCVPGWAEMVVVGFTLDGDKEVTKIKTEPSRFRVLPGSSRAADNEGVAPTVADQLQAEIEAVEAELDDKKVNKPVTPHDGNGTKGQILESLGDGKTRWVDKLTITSDQIESVLEEHPEWTTTVQDESISTSKLADDVKMRRIVQTVEWMPEHIHTNWTRYAPNAPDYVGLQGGCFIFPRQTYVIAMMSVVTSDNIKLVEYSMADGSKLRETVLELQHANWLTYVPEEDEILVASCKRATDDYTSLLYVIDAESLTLKDTINLKQMAGDVNATARGVSLLSCDYDKVKKTYLAMYKYFDADTLKGNLVFVLWDRDEGTSRRIDLELTDDEMDLGTYQGAMVHDGVAYLLDYTKAYMGAYSLASGKLLLRIAVQTAAENGVPLGELEQIAPMSSDAEPSFMLISRWMDNNYSWTSHNIISFVDIFKGRTIKETRVRYAWFETPGEIYVKYNTGNAVQDGSYTHPFSSIGLAVEVSARMPHRTREINLVEAVNVGPIALYHDCTILGNGMTMEGLSVAGKRVVLINVVLHNDAKAQCLFDDDSHYNFLGADVSIFGAEVKNRTLDITARDSRLALRGRDPYDAENVLNANVNLKSSAVEISSFAKDFSGLICTVNGGNYRSSVSIKDGIINADQNGPTFPHLYAINMLAFQGNSGHDVATLITPAASINGTANYKIAKSGAAALKCWIDENGVIKGNMVKADTLQDTSGDVHFSLL